MPIGIKFKTAIKALKNAMRTATSARREDEGRINVKVKATMQKTMFVKGPAMEVFPMVSLLAFPATITAPGEIILKKGEIIDTSVTKAPMRVNRNSAHNP